MLKDVEVLVLRATVGGLMAGHGAQKLIGAFEGPGLQGTAGMMKSLGFEPADRWALAAALSEFGGFCLGGHEEFDVNCETRPPPE